MGSRSIVRLISRVVLLIAIGVGLTACSPPNDLDPQGPWLVLGTAIDGRTMDGIVALNADGSGLTPLLADRIIVGPNEFGAGLSPDGRHLAYITAADTNLHDLTLNLLTLPAGDTQVLTPLLSPSTAPDLEARTLADPSYAAVNAIAGQDRSLVWSPDGTRLAFIGAQSGSSADLYLYSLSDSSITHLSHEPEQAMRPTWSPNGDTILFQTYDSFEIAGGFEMGSVLLVDAVTGSAQILYEPGEVEDELVVGWVSDEEVLVFSRDVACGWHDLRSFDVGRGRAVSIWPSYFNKMSYHPDSQTFLLSIDSYTAACNDSDQSGLFLLSFGSQALSQVADFAPVELAASPDGFYAVTLEPAVFEVSLSGELDRLPDPIAFVPIASPDGGYWAWAGQHPKFEAGLWGGPSGEVPELIYEGAVQVVTWTPDGQSLFFVGDNSLYHWSLADDQPVLIAEDIVLRDFRGAVWASP